MGNYFVGMHLTKQPPEAEAIRDALPPSIGFRVYRHSTLDIFAINTFAGTDPPRYPFTNDTSARDLSLELGHHLRSLAETYEKLRRSGGANGIKRSYINLAEKLSEVLGQPVLSICSNDDDLDFACLAEKGMAAIIIALCDETLVRYVNGITEITAAGEEMRLHQYAIEAFEDFTGAGAETIGLGLWDPPVDFGFVRC
jgi:hypothetical protein